MKQKKQKSKLRTLNLPEPKRHYIGMAGFDNTQKIKIKDTSYPYTQNGFISPEGWFFECGAYAHATWCSNLGLSSTYLEENGWLFVWNYSSMFNKPGDYTEYIRWKFENKLTEEQKTVILKWCEAQNCSLERALGKSGLQVFNGEYD